MMIRQLLLLSEHPHPPLKFIPLPPQQQKRRMIIQIIELHPHPFISLHPQFVAAKSLIRDLQKFDLQYSLCAVIKCVTKKY